ncbi:DUF3348 family protein [uncultured Limnohabitans sp.]|uniref:DUF3348 family protein n=1 Tax=uncultured Limnohabitans sp. TaxID=768543 RepID=UPI002626C98C|nr:DUF3348 family protein [uncultured Limnohabitans sp.]
MTRALPRAHINSSSLVRFLTENAMLDAAQAGEGVGQKLGDWLNFRQAIALHGVLQNDAAPAPIPGHQQRAAPISPQALAAHVEKVRAQLTESVLQGAPPGSGLARIDMPPPELDDPPEPKTAFEPYRRFLAAHQRQMETTVRNLRAQLRLQLSKRGPAGAQLAALDAAFESILGEREAALLAKVSKPLEKRFVQALKAHLQAPEDPARWLMPLRQTLRTALLAELDTRLQPSLGLLEALTPEALHTP